MTYVFVYGTLKKGYGNNSILRTSKFIGEGHTLECCFRMFDGPFPYVMLDGDKLWADVIGEVYEVDDYVLAELDSLEGVEYGHYDRYNTNIYVHGLDEELNCIMYVASEQTAASLKYRRDEIENEDGFLLWTRN